MHRKLDTLTAQLQAIIDDAGVASGVVGAQVSVILGDSRADFVYGTANVELNLPMTTDTIVQVGSVCKVPNAALVMTLVEENKLALDTPVIEYLPDFKLADQRAQATISLRQLLSMSSGLDNGPYDEHGRGEDALGRYVASLRDLPQIFPPGEGFGYSNAGTSIAGHVAERVTGLGWDTLIRQRIFEPAGMMHTVTLAEELAFHRVSAGHTRAQAGQSATVVRPWFVTRAQGPAGSTLTMSAHDLATFGQIFINGGMAAQGRRVLSQASVMTMMTPTTDVPVSASFAGLGRKWGLGPTMDRWGSTVVWGHGGGNRGGRSRLVWFPEQRGVLAVAINTLQADDDFTTKIFGDLSKLVFGAGAEMPLAPEPPLRLENPRRFVGLYERYGTHYEVSEEAGGLRFKVKNLGSGKQHEELGLIVDSRLIPLGGDRFLIEVPGRAERPIQRSSALVGFFGNDAHSRAANLVAPFLPARRLD